jgi:hypothetical protein
MKIMYNVKKETFENQNVTYGKEYEVIADYRTRPQNKGWSRDDGFVIKDDNGQVEMLLLEDIKITDNNIGNTFIFEYKKGKLKGDELK